jgi:hypothetical protein
MLGVGGIGDSSIEICSLPQLLPQGQQPPYGCNCWFLRTGWCVLDYTLGNPTTSILYIVLCSELEGRRIRVPQVPLRVCTETSMGIEEF